MMGASLVRFVPDIGDIIQLREGHPSRIAEGKYYGVRRWRVTGYMRAWKRPQLDPKDGLFRNMLQDILDEANREFDHGKGRTRLQWCHRYEAEFVTGSGVAGCCYPVEDVVKIGTVQWSKAAIDGDRIRSYWHIGHVLF